MFFGEAGLSFTVLNEYRLFVLRQAPPYCFVLAVCFYGASRTSPPTMNGGDLVRRRIVLFSPFILCGRPMVAPTKTTRPYRCL